MAKIKVKNSECLALIDTGSEVNAVDKKLIGEHPDWGQVFDSDANLTGVGKEKVDTHGKVKITFTFTEYPGNILSEEFEILEDLDRGFILGSGFLRKHEISIQNYAKDSFLWKPSTSTRIRLVIPEQEEELKVNIILKNTNIKDQPVQRKPKRLINIKCASTNKSKKQNPSELSNAETIESFKEAYDRQENLHTAETEPKPAAKIFNKILCTSSDWNLEKGAETNQWIKLMESEEKLKTGDVCLIEPMDSKGPKDFLVGRTLVTVKEGTIPLKIMNLSSVKSIVKKNTKIAKVVKVNANEYKVDRWEDQREVSHTNYPSLTGIVETINESKHDLCKKLLEEHPWMTNIQIGSLTDDQRYETYKVVKKHEKAFSKHENDIGRTDLMEVKINLDKKEPIKTKQYAVPPHKREILKEQVQKFKDLKVIQPSTSPYNAPTVLVTKPDKSYRLCIDFRKLNEHTIKEAVPLINFEEASQLLASNKFFSSLDLYSGYLQLPLEKSSQEKTAFTVGTDHYEFNCLPFGVTNGVANFQNLINIIFGDIQMEKILCYVDDILIIAKTFEEHLARLDIVLGRLVKAKLKLKPKKCSLLKTELIFLGIVISVDGIWPAERKIGAIQEFQTPQTRKQLRSFLGLTNFFKRFIENYALVAAPLYDLTSDKTKFLWTEKMENAFIKLKELLLCPPILRHPEFTKKFHVWADASLIGLGAVLTQEQEEGGHAAIAFASKKLTNTQSRYSVTELELLGVVFAIKHFSCYLQGRHFLIHTDHCPLTYLMNTKSDTKARHFRWLLEIQAYEFTIIHNKGTENSAADALSRNPAFLENREELKNDTINLLKRTPVDQEELYSWKHKINNQLGVKMKKDHPNTIKYIKECKDSLYQQISNLLTHSLDFTEDFRTIIRKFEMKHRKYVDLAAPEADEENTVHFKHIKTGAQGTELEIVALAGLLKIPIIYISKNQTKVTLGGMHSDLEGFPPVGAALELKKDEFGNWIWTNPTMEILEHDSSNRITRKPKNEKQVSRKRGDLLDTEEVEEISGDDLNDEKPTDCTVCKINLLKDEALYVPTVKEYIACQQEDGYCQAWTKYILKKEHPGNNVISKREFKRLCDAVFLHVNGLLMVRSEIISKRSDRTNLDKIIVPLSMLKYVFQGNHDLMGHIGREKSLELIKRKYYRPNMAELLTRYIKSCMKCASKGGNRGITKAPLGSFPINTQRFAAWNIDIMGPLATSKQGSKYILSCIENYTRWLELIPLDNIKSPTIARAIVQNIVCRFGVPYSLYSDRGANFRSDIMKEVYKVLGIKKQETLPYSPSSNGKVERSNLFVINVLKTMVNEEQEEWESQLPFVLLAYRASIHQFTDTTPAYLVYGSDLVLPQHLMIDLPVIGKPGLDTSKQSVGTEIALRLRKANETYLKTLDNKVKTRNEKLNEDRKDIRINIGDSVYLKRPFVKQPGKCEKLAAKFVGPYRVIKKMGDLGFEILEIGGRKRFEAHRNNIVPSFLPLRKEVELWAKEGEKIIEELKLKEITPSMVLNLDTNPMDSDDAETKDSKLQQNRASMEDTRRTEDQEDTKNKEPKLTEKEILLHNANNSSKQKKVTSESDQKVIKQDPSQRQNIEGESHKLRSGKTWKENNHKPKKINTLIRRGRLTTQEEELKNLTHENQTNNNQKTNGKREEEREIELLINMKNTQRQGRSGYSNLVTTELIGPNLVTINVAYSNDFTLNLSVPKWNEAAERNKNSNVMTNNRYPETNRIKIIMEDRLSPRKAKNSGHLLLPISCYGENIGDLEVFYPRTIDPEVSIKGPCKMDERTIFSRTGKKTEKANLTNMAKVGLAIVILILTIYRGIHY